MPLTCGTQLVPWQQLTDMHPQMERVKNYLSAQLRAQHMVKPQPTPAHLERAIQEVESSM